MKICVTGGCGFIGRHLCERLLEQGHEVIAVDNLFTSSKSNIISLLKKYPYFEFIRHDITFPLYLEVDQIYNLACPASPIHYQKDPIQTTKVCVLGAINMLGLAKRLKCKILQASTSEVYGDPEIHPQIESYWGKVNPNGPRSCYDEGKRCAESLFINYHKEHNVDVKIARIFNTYGPYMQVNDGRVVSNFINQCLTNQDITIYGDGNQTRSFCYVSDLVDGLIKLMNSNYNEPVNLGNPNEITIKELANQIINNTITTSKLIFKDLPIDDPIKRKPDILLAKHLLDWEPKIDLIDGLKRTIFYFSEKLNKIK